MEELEKLQESELSFNDVYCAIQLILERDMNSLVFWGFHKLDIFSQSSINRNLLKNALLALMWSHNDPLMKKSLQTILRDLNESSTLASFDRERFHKCLLSNLHSN